MLTPIKYPAITTSISTTTHKNMHPYIFSRLSSKDRSLISKCGSPVRGCDSISELFIIYIGYS